ncbi:MAG: tyrosine recombinase XerC [Betaproteobacteria bacterium]|nr:tyrosine recombinase XerC [Betaproteobacteria bacterium]MBI3935436.1 tyrosine recombinase XerC [Betaproteobacteria bacterium]
MSARQPETRNRKPGTARHLLQGYLDHLGGERRLSPHTASSYARDIGALLELAAGSSLRELKIHHVRRFVAQLHARGLAGRTLARMLSAWRGFFRYLARDHGYTHNPCLGLRAPKAPRTLPHALSPDEAARLVAVEGEDFAALRDRAVFELFYSSGLRLSELTALAPGDVNFSDATVRVTGKGAKTRVVPVGSYALDALRKWLACRDALPAKDGRALFVNKQGRRLPARTIQHRLKRWAVRLGVAANVHPHMLRHSFASHLLQSSGDLRAVQEMLGHASISTTQVYTHLDFQHLAKVYDAAHPRARRKR